MAPTHSTQRLVAVNWKDQAQKSYYFGRGDLVERSQDSWASVVHKDLA
jgi:RNA-binding protein YlmH